MARSGARVLLVSQHDGVWREACERALRERGVDTVQAHNCWSAEVAQELHGAEALLVDGRIVCDFVSPVRPGPILAPDAKLPVLIFNAQAMEDPHRSAAFAREASLLDGDEVAVIAERLGRVLDGGG